MSYLEEKLTTNKECPAVDWNGGRAKGKCVGGL